MVLDARTPRTVTCYMASIRKSASARMSIYRQRMRAAGLRPVQLWVPDTSNPAFIEECRRQSAALRAHDQAGDEIMEWIEAAYEWPE